MGSPTVGVELFKHPLGDHTRHLYEEEQTAPVFEQALSQLSTPYVVVPQAGAVAVHEPFGMHEDSQQLAPIQGSQDSAFSL